MPVTLHYHGHANIELHSGPYRLQFDPFYTSNPLADRKTPLAPPTHILLSHAHFDHIEDAEAIARSSGAQIIANHEIAIYYAAKGLKNTHGMNLGGGHDFPFGRATLVLALHTSSFPDGTYGGAPGGFVVQIAGKTIYFAGDTAIFSDMALIGKLWTLDLAILPIGDNYTLGPAHALAAVEMLKPKLVMPMHYNTFPAIQQDPDTFVRNLQKQSGAKAIVLKPGESFEL